MCGRYVRRGDKQRIAVGFHVRGELDGLSTPPDDYNVAPSTFQPVTRENREDGTREMALMR
jgi:putative SOS response-associated peptidase YedK